jgi:signal-transduction protein with cAMP-binding, CBS, and nucleotidyltransferase domain
MRVRDFMRPRADALAVREGTSCSEMVAHMAATRASCAVVVDAAGRPLGIITERDIARRIAYRVPAERPVESVMSAPVMTIARRDFLYHAIAWMRRHKLRHMPVVDGQGRLAGMLYLHDALAAASGRLLGQIDSLTHEGTQDGLKNVRAAQIDLAEELFAENVAATDIQQLLTHINNDIYRRIGESAMLQMRDEGWGDPPVTACVIVMGSGGRGENYLFPDQDNGFILGDYPDAEHTPIDTYFIELAERLCGGLNDVGIPFCNGYCMAINPLWRKTASQWVDQITRWSRTSNFVAIRLADIFFDFQPVWGERRLAADLRQAVTEKVRHNHFFLRQMFQDQADHNVAIGLFGGFQTEREKREYRGHVHLKYAGIIPLVESVRLLALREGVEETSTLERIRILRDAGVLSLTEADDLTAAFHRLTDTLLHSQLAEYRAGRRVTYYVSTKTMNKRDQALLLDALKAVDELRKRVRVEFTADIF